MKSSAVVLVDVPILAAAGRRWCGVRALAFLKESPPLTEVFVRDNPLQEVHPRLRQATGSIGNV